MIGGRKGAQEWQYAEQETTNAFTATMFSGAGSLRESLLACIIAKNDWFKFDLIIHDLSLGGKDDCF